MYRLFITGLLTALAATSLPSQANDDLVAKGEEIFLARCEYCHGSGPHRPATLTLGRRYEGTDIPAPLADRTNLTPEMITLFVRNNTPSMAAIRKTEITDEELTWLIAYLTRNNN